MTVADLELADAIARYAGLAGDRANKIARAHTIAFANAEEHAREFAPSRRAARTRSDDEGPIASAFSARSARVRACSPSLDASFDGRSAGLLSRPLRFDPSAVLRFGRAR